MSEPMSEQTLATLEALGQTTRSPSVRLLCKEVRRLQAALIRSEQAHAADSEVWTEERDRLRAVYDAGRALFRLKDTGSSDDLYRAWRELGAQLAFADGQIPLGSDADLGRTRGER